jgi:hypothetical protein
MPNASAPNAPWVLVWLSPQTIVMPGCVRPSSGAITCTIPRSGESQPRSAIPNSTQLRSSWVTCARVAASRYGREPSALRGSVGVVE